MIYSSQELADSKGTSAPVRAALLDMQEQLARKSDAIQRLWKERDELRALNAELVEALRLADLMLSGANMDAKAVERAVKAALANSKVNLEGKAK